MSDTLLLIAPLMIPFLGAASALLLRSRPAAATAIGLIAAALTAAVSTALLLRIFQSGPPAMSVFGGWPHGFGVSFSATLPGAALVFITGLVALAAAIYALGDIGPRRRRAGYDALMLAMIGAVNGAFLTEDLFNLYVWFELALLSALGLLTLDRRAAQIDGAIRYAAFAMLAATFILLGVGMVYGLTGTLHIGAAASALAKAPPSFASATAAALLLGGLMLKSGLVPFHLWLPASYHTAPITVAAVFAGLLTKMGFFALLIVLGGVFGIGSGGVGAAQLVPLLGAFAAATMLICVTGALAQTDMRRMLAYHVIAQVGYMMAALALATRDGLAAAVFYMIHSIVVQANLFFGAGLIRRACGSWDLTRTGGVVRKEPLLALLLAVPILSLAGIPPFSGFWAKLIVIRESFSAGMAWLGAVAILAGLLTIISMANFWSDACWRQARTPMRRVPRSGLAAMALLSITTLMIGVAPQWLLSIARMSARMIGDAS
ncbi:proton-conducting transporter membrane subunit [Caulobacter segnis]|uniref:proton-conducting transporter transmembrane domain-containing protein n=1 Tax=Caulobacter segnis TaxID=88688 RepID=UPI00240F1D19|nr:proton-conducting transporter membrane subunit [Caulobacter segnis]MDG2520703.1 proton-conducting transporter membrane subunit [Caulobacter segnis]